jgi:hypothetical protein
MIAWGLPVGGSGAAAAARAARDSTETAAAVSVCARSCERVSWTKRHRRELGIFFYPLIFGSSGLVCRKLSYFWLLMQ